MRFVGMYIVNCITTHIYWFIIRVQTLGCSRKECPNDQGTHQSRCDHRINGPRSRYSLDNCEKTQRLSVCESATAILVYL